VLPFANLSHVPNHWNRRANSASSRTVTEAKIFPHRELKARNGDYAFGSNPPYELRALRVSENSMEESVEPGTKVRFGDLMPAGSKQTRRQNMAKDEHNKAAEHHENAAKAHRSAAEHHGKGDHTKGKEHANVAKQHSQAAHQHTDQAHSKSQQQK
jgi:hypothetical protein